MEASTHNKIRKMWKIYAWIVGVILLFVILIYNGIIGYMPPIEELKNPRMDNASVILSADGQELGRYFNRTGNRTNEELTEISPHVVNALIATEDVRFEEHSGIDLRATMRAIVKTGLLRHKNAGGASTITQQLAKQLYTQQTSSRLARMFQKPVEWMIAVKLERFFSKDEILKMYLNQFDFLYNAVGINSAAQTYFGKKAKDLDLHEAAMLVGMVKNPAYYNPHRAPERAIKRRNVVFEQMYKADMLTQAELDSLKALPLGLHFTPQDHKEGLAPYFREELRRMMTAREPQRDNYPSWNQQAYVTDSVAWATNPLYGWIEKNPKPDGTKYDLYKDGLRIYTTIDSRMQTYAEEAVREHMADLQRRFFEEKGQRNPYTSNTDELSAAGKKRLINAAIRQSERWRVGKEAGLSDHDIMAQFDRPVEMTLFSYDGPKDVTMTPRDSLLYVKSILRTGFMTMDPRTGYVKTYVGGPDYHYFMYDMVSQGRRQIGSTIKPFLYTYAMEEGMDPCTTMLNAQPVLHDAGGKPWLPRNSGNSRVGEMVPLRWALTMSNNWISARIMDRLNPAELVKLMHNFGITSRIPAVISLCLGPSEVSVKEMVSAYTAFANEGTKVDPMFVTKIVDGNGATVATFTKNSTAVISRDAYWRMLSMLLNVVDSGTGNRVRSRYGITAQMGGKTGTTNNNSDGWFMSFTPELVSGVWVGGDERYIHFNSMANGQGAEMALPIFGKFMKRVYADPQLPYSQSTTFQFPYDVEICPGATYAPEAPQEAEESIEGAFD